MPKRGKFLSNLKKVFKREPETDGDSTSDDPPWTDNSSLAEGVGCFCASLILIPSLDPTSMQKGGMGCYVVVFERPLFGVLLRWYRRLLI